MPVDPSLFLSAANLHSETRHELINDHSSACHTDVKLKYFTFLRQSLAVGMFYTVGIPLCSKRDEESLNRKFVLPKSDDLTDLSCSQTPYQPEKILPPRCI